MKKISIKSPGLRIFNSCDKKSALPYIKNHLIANPNDGLAYYYLGLTYEIIGDKIASNNSYSDGILKASCKAEKWYIFTKLCLKAGNLKKAVNSIEYSISYDPSFGEPMSLRGDIYKKQKKYELAISSYKKANNLNASNANWNYFSMAEIYIAEGKFYEAEKMLNMAIKVCDCFTAAYLLKSQLAAVRKDWISHEKCIQEAMRYNPIVVYEFRGKISNNTEYVKIFDEIVLSSKHLVDSMKTFAFIANKRDGIIVEFNDNLENLNDEINGSNRDKIIYEVLLASKQIKK